MFKCIKTFFLKLTFEILEDLLKEVSLKLILILRKRPFEKEYYYYSHINNQK